MRIIKTDEILYPVKEMILDAAFNLECDILTALSCAAAKESSEIGKNILAEIMENSSISRTEKLPLCQDTGFAVFFVEIGQDCFIEGNLNKILQQATSEAYTEGYLRKSILNDPIKGLNTGDNTPPVVWIEETIGDKLTIAFTAKGGGAENMSAVKMLKPADGVAGIKKFVLETVVNAGGNACPPMIIGIGIGGTFEKCAWLAKKALLRSLDEHHSDPYYADLENELLSLINQTGVGAQGLGGNTTALGVMIETFPRHIASLPVAINIQCHSSRHKTITI